MWHFPWRKLPILSDWIRMQECSRLAITLLQAILKELIAGIIKHVWRGI